MNLEKPRKSDRKPLGIDKSELALPVAAPARNASYRAWVRSHPCALKGFAGHRCYGEIEAAHIGKHGLGVKSSDYTVLPFRHRAHEIQTQMGWPQFIATYDFSPYEIAFWMLENWVRRAVKG